MYYVLDGRHRLVAARLRGKKDLRCDVIHGDGSVGLRVIPTNELEVDPDVQLEFTSKKTHAASIAANWQDEYVGVLAVIPADTKMTSAVKAAIKGARDRDRRKVTSLENFRIELLAKMPEAVAVNKLVTEAGWEVGRVAGGTNYTVIEAVRALRILYRADVLSNVLDLNSIWFGEPTTNKAAWLLGLGQFCLEGSEARLTSASRERLDAQIPQKLLNAAIGEVTGIAPTQSGSVNNPLSRATAKQLRKAARLRTAKKADA